MREIIAAIQVSVDGFIEGPGGAIDWIEAWGDPFEAMPDVDTLVLGGRMHAGYEEYWSAVQGSPNGILPFTGRTPTPAEVAYADFAARNTTRGAAFDAHAGALASHSHRFEPRGYQRVERGARPLDPCGGGASFVSSLIQSRARRRTPTGHHPHRPGTG